MKLSFILNEVAVRVEIEPSDLLAFYLIQPFYRIRCRCL